MNDQGSLFGADSEGFSESESSAPPGSEPARVLVPERDQVRFETYCLEETLAADHPARTIWAALGKLDLSAFYAPLKARGSSPGRPATDPRLLAALWLLGATEGIGSAREIARLCGRDDAYRWLCGGVPVNHHALSDFRVSHEAALDGLLSQAIAALVYKGLVRVTRVSQDGTRLRASAGMRSMTRRETLEKQLAEARRHVRRLKLQGEGEVSAREAAATERAAREKMERLEAALEAVAEIQARKDGQKEKPSKKREALASKTDPEARLMRMPGGGTRPAYNVQLATDVESRAIVGVSVTNEGSDARLSEPMRRQAEARTGARASEWLMDGGYVGLGSLEAAAAEGVTVYAPVPKAKRKDGDRHAPRETDGPGVAEWRARMKTEEAKAIYKKRASTSETVNADLKTHRGLGPLTVRGLAKVKCAALWSALAYNLLHFGGALIGA